MGHNNYPILASLWSISSLEKCSGGTILVATKICFCFPSCFSLGDIILHTHRHILYIRNLYVKGVAGGLRFSIYSYLSFLLPADRPRGKWLRDRYKVLSIKLNRTEIPRGGCAYIYTCAPIMETSIAGATALYTEDSWNIIFRFVEQYRLELAKRPLYYIIILFMRIKMTARARVYICAANLCFIFPVQNTI